MSTNLQATVTQESLQTAGGVWYQLHSEREEICEALLREPWPSNQCRAVIGESRNVDQLQKRLRLIDDALDRLTAGSYGDCVVCGRWIEDHKLHADPAVPYCCECRRKYENRYQPPSVGLNGDARSVCYR